MHPTLWANIHHQIELEEVPEEINEDYQLAILRLLGITQLVREATDDAYTGKYVDSSSAIERARQSMAILDKNLEEIYTEVVDDMTQRMANVYKSEDYEDLVIGAINRAEPTLQRLGDFNKGQVKSILKVKKQDQLFNI